MAEPMFTWVGHDREGRVVQGQMSAPNRQAVRDQLLTQRIRATRVRRQFGLTYWQRPRAVRAPEVTRLTRQLATLLSSGVPLLQAFDIIERGLRASALKDVLRDVHHQVAGGMALNQALRQHAAFDTLYCDLVAVGEMAGMLDTMLARLAEHREKTQALHNTLRSALVYPCAVLVIALAVMVFLLSFVVPAFQNIFASFDAELPTLTRWVIAMSDAWQRHGWLWLLAGAGVAAGLHQAMARSVRLKRLWHRCLLRLPMVGRVIRHACLARWTRTLATLFAAGIPLVEALEAVQGVTGHVLYQEATQSIRDQLMRGHALAQATSVHDRLFSAMVVQMCAIGEESGALDQMLNTAASHYERDVETAVARIATLLEPFIMVTLGLLIGGMVVALYLPIFQLGQVV